MKRSHKKKRLTDVFKNKGDQQALYLVLAQHWAMPEELCDRAAEQAYGASLSDWNATLFMDKIAEILASVQ